MGNGRGARGGNLLLFSKSREFAAFYVFNKVTFCQKVDHAALITSYCHDQVIATYNNNNRNKTENPSSPYPRALY
jgi:hypothetical protein